MYKLLPVLMLTIFPLTILAEEKKPEFTDDQLTRLKAAEEKYKDNPEVTKLIGNLKDQYGLNEETEENQPPPAATQEPALQGDRSVAEQAYKNRDYSTAIEHYKALAAEGDADASLRLGTMYDMGKGTDRDPAAAHAWYQRAADLGDSRAEAALGFIEKHSLDEEGMMQAEEQYKQINKELEGQPVADSKDQADAGTDPAIKFSVNPETTTGQWKNSNNAETREVNISPEKFNPMQHAKPAVNGEHIQPGKFNRSPPSETTTDS